MRNKAQGSKNRSEDPVMVNAMHDALQARRASMPEPQRMQPVELRSRRSALGLDQEGLADMLGVTQATLSRWETGKQPVPLLLGEELAEIEDTLKDLSVGYCELIGHKSAMIDSPYVDLPAPMDDGDALKLDPKGELPAGIMRVAAARAAVEARQESEILVRLVRP
jgi:DNA-binding transcriptional regulator YiaG